MDRMDQEGRARVADTVQPENMQIGSHGRKKDMQNMRRSLNTAPPEAVA